MKSSEVLKQAWSLIDSPEKWVQGRLAADANGHGVGLGSSNACKFCSIGALETALYNEHIETSGKFRNMLDASLDFLVPGFVLKGGVLGLLGHKGNKGIIQYNDTHTHAEVAKVWELAIKQAELSEEAENAST